MVEKNDQPKNQMKYWHDLLIWSKASVPWQFKYLRNVKVQLICFKILVIENQQKKLPFQEMWSSKWENDLPNKFLVEEKNKHQYKRKKSNQKQIPTISFLQIVSLYVLKSEYTVVIWSMNGGVMCGVWCVVCADGCNCRKPIAAYRCLSFSYHARKYYILHFKAFIVLIYYYAYNKTVCHLFLKLNVYLEVFVINIKTKCKKTRFWKTFLSNTT